VSRPRTVIAHGAFRAGLDYLRKGETPALAGASSDASRSSSVPHLTSTRPCIQGWIAHMK
jgi:hypothetical protein